MEFYAAEGISFLFQLFEGFFDFLAGGLVNW